MFNLIRTHLHVSVFFMDDVCFFTVLPGNSGGTGIKIRWHRIWSAALVTNLNCWSDSSSVCITCYVFTHLLCTPRMLRLRGSSMFSWKSANLAFKAKIDEFHSLHILRGSSQSQSEYSKAFIIYLLWALIDVVINHQKVEIETTSGLDVGFGVLYDNMIKGLIIWFKHAIMFYGNCRISK